LRQGILNILLWALALSPATAGQDLQPIEATLAAELLQLEASVRDVPKEVEPLFRAVLEEATTRALAVSRHPKSQAEALAVLEAIQLVLVQRNFLQPPEEKDWPQTLGFALTERKFTSEQLAAVLDYSDNRKRVPHLDRAKPFYFVDCDMGAQFFLAVGQRAGWDIRLVEVPRHNFVRWHLNDTEKINWDWSHGDTRPDDRYQGTLDMEDPRIQALYLKSLETREARAYYLSLVGPKAKDPKDAERLLKEAVRELPNHPLTLNNLAWLYATVPEVGKGRSRLAVSYALAAWSIDPEHGNTVDTVACALAADGKKELAGKVEEFALAHAGNAEQLASLKRNLEQIGRGRQCEP
jgi:hypothetical protein